MQRITSCCWNIALWDSSAGKLGPEYKAPGLAHFRPHDISPANRIIWDVERSGSRAHEGYSGNRNRFIPDVD